MGAKLGCSKLREWVGTVTGKGDRWGRDREGRSAPAFLAASTTALPPSTCTARREAGQRYWQLLLCYKAGQLLAVCFEACAGRRVRRLCPPAVACSAGCVPAVHPLPAMPTALHKFLPPFSSLCLPPSSSLCFAAVHSMCARIGFNMFASCKTVPLAAATRACSGGPCAGSIC